MKQILLIISVAAFAVSPVNAEDRVTHTIKHKASKGTVTIETPASWGKKPEVTQGESATLIGFTPAGTRRDPIFGITLLFALPDEPLNEAGIQALAEQMRTEFEASALEEDIPINAIAGERNMIKYFTLTDKEIKPREYQYLTAAVASDGSFAMTAYFFTNDGAPDYAADAMHLLETVRYTPKK